MKVLSQNSMTEVQGGAAPLVWAAGVAGAALGAAAYTRAKKAYNNYKKKKEEKKKEPVQHTGPTATV